MKPSRRPEMWCGVALKRTSMPKKSNPQVAREICILAGGLSRRMGRNKSRLGLGGKTMLARIRATAEATRLPVRIITRDIVPRCGPLGGILTALRTTKADAVLFLACDMPFVSVELLAWLLGKSSGASGFFTRANGQAGFPFLVPRDRIVVVEKQLAQREFSLHKLAAALRAKQIKVPTRFAEQLRNINTREDLRFARDLIRQRAMPVR